MAALAVAAGYFLYWQSQYEELEAGAQQEQKLREEYKLKIAQAVNGTYEGGFAMLCVTNYRVLLVDPSRCY